MALASGSSLPGGAAKFINEVVLPAEVALPGEQRVSGAWISDGEVQRLKIVPLAVYLQLALFGPRPQAR